MKPPRYLLREHIVNQMLQDMKPGVFLEVGYGNGNMLVNLSKHGYSGDGFDISDDARGIAARNIRYNNISNVTLLSKLDIGKKYEYIFGFEVIGYLADSDLKLFRKMLTNHGNLILSFVRKGAIYSSKALGKNRFYSRDEINEQLMQAGFKVVRVWNYGFPLANILAPLMNMVIIGNYLCDGSTNQILTMKRSGLLHENMLFRLLVPIVFNKVTIYPFAKLQLCFRKTNLGNGYVVLAQKA